MSEKRLPKYWKRLSMARRIAIVLVLGYVLLAGFCQIFGRFYIYQYEKYNVFHPDGTKRSNSPSLEVPSEDPTTTLLPFVLDFKERRLQGVISVSDFSYSKDVATIEVDHLSLVPVGRR